MNSTRRQARIAGLWYLLLGITAPIGLVYVPGKIIVPGNAAATIGWRDGWRWRDNTTGAFRWPE